MIKKYRITSKVRFTVFVAIVALLVFTGISTVAGLNTVKGTSFNTYETHVVASGETLWSIASNSTDKKTDIRKRVYEISEANNLAGDEMLQDGQILVIPLN